VAERKERFAVLSRFEKHWAVNGFSTLQINKYNEQWAADALLESFSMDEIYDAMTYYFQINPRPTWKGFANNIDRLIQSKKEKEEDNRLRAERRLMAKEWLNESRG
jgi:hypothetical protein